VTVVGVDAPHGRANAHLHLADRPKGALILGYGAGGGVTSRDLVAVTDAALSEGSGPRSWSSPTTWPGVVALLRHGSSDSAWTAIVADLCGDVLEGLPLIVGGRSLGARVACRTARITGALGCYVSRSRCSRHAAPRHRQQRADCPSSMR
jgi:uncharacterized protein